MHGGIGDEPILAMTDAYVKKLIRDLGAERPAVRREARIALALHTGKRVTNEMLDNLNTKNDKRRLLIVHILGNKDDERIEPALIEALQMEKEQNIRHEICNSLGSTGKTKETIDALSKLTTNGDKSLMIKAKACIGKIRKRMNVALDRTDSPHRKKVDLITMGEIKSTKEELQVGNRRFMESTGELLEKMREFSNRKRKSAALRRAEKTLKRMKEEKTRA